MFLSVQSQNEKAAFLIDVIKKDVCSLGHSLKKFPYFTLLFS